VFTMWFTTKPTAWGITLPMSAARSPPLQYIKLFENLFILVIQT
jgi:hypothetical protein